MGCTVGLVGDGGTLMEMEMEMVMAPLLLDLSVKIIYNMKSSPASRLLVNASNFTPSQGQAAFDILLGRSRSDDISIQNRVSHAWEADGIQAPPTYLHGGPYANHIPYYY